MGCSVFSKQGVLIKKKLTWSFPLIPQIQIVLGSKMIKNDRIIFFSSSSYVMECHDGMPSRDEAASAVALDTQDVVGTS